MIIQSHVNTCQPADWLPLFLAQNYFVFQDTCCRFYILGADVLHSINRIKLRIFHCHWEMRPSVFSLPPRFFSAHFSSGLSWWDSMSNLYFSSWVHFKQFRSFKISPFGFLPSINFRPKNVFDAHITGDDNINRWNLRQNDNNAKQKASNIFWTHPKKTVSMLSLLNHYLF